MESLPIPTGSSVPPRHALFWEWRGRVWSPGVLSEPERAWAGLTTCVLNVNSGVASWGSSIHKTTSNQCWRKKSNRNFPPNQSGDLECWSRVTSQSPVLQHTPGRELIMVCCQITVSSQSVSGSSYNQRPPKAKTHSMWVAAAIFSRTVFSQNNLSQM